jgi:hypothetical protein
MVIGSKSTESCNHLDMVNGYWLMVLSQLNHVIT